MKKILVINTSPRGERSYSRKLTSTFVQQWKIKYPNDEIIEREVGRGNIPHIDEDWITAAFKSNKDRTVQNHEALKISNMLTDEFLWADIYVIGVPMYNWSIPSGFKAYIDQILRIGKTWGHDKDHKHIGLVHNKKLFLFFTRGGNGYELGGMNAFKNFQTPYVKFVFEMMGISDISEVYLENEERPEKLFEESLNLAYNKIKNLITDND
jgi:FMN-dependent NADH-azoreductase